MWAVPISHQCHRINSWKCCGNWGLAPNTDVERLANHKEVFLSRFINGIFQKWAFRNQTRSKTFICFWQIVNYHPLSLLYIQTFWSYPITLRWKTALGSVVGLPTCQGRIYEWTWKLISAKELTPFCEKKGYEKSEQFQNYKTS